jgi:hypothetical protein
MMSKANIDFAQHNSGATWRLGYFLLFAVLVASGLYVAFVAGPAYRATTQQQLAQAVADEDRGFCERFGMRAGTSEFRTCSEHLAIIRQNQADRDRGAEAGIL